MYKYHCWRLLVWHPLICHSLLLLSFLKETETNYALALDKLCGLFVNELYPSVIVINRDLALTNVVKSTFSSSQNFLCKWYVNQKVLINCKKLLNQYHEWEKSFSMWMVVMLLDTPEEYNAHLNILINEFLTFPNIIDYVTKTWLIPYKEKFVAYWTNICLYRNNVTNNRAESTHTKLKSQLQTS